MKSKNTNYLPRLDHLRFFAALLVVAYHLTGSQLPMESANPLNVIVRSGETGVSLFMVLSGFILSKIAIDNDISYKPFIVNRILRIYPLYILALAVAVYTGGRHMDFISIVSMLSTVGLVANVNLPKFPQIWTIAVEFQFYLIFPFMMIFLKRYGVRYLFGIVMLAISIRVISFITEGSVEDASYWTIIGRIDQFSIGILAAIAYASNRKFMTSPILLAAALTAAYGWLYLFGQWTGGFHSATSPKSSVWILAPTIDAVVWAVVIISYLKQKWKMPALIDKILAFLGSISFSIYVWHYSILELSNKIPQIFVFQEWYLNFIFTIMPIIIALSSLSYFVVEMPFFSMRKIYASKHLPVAHDSADLNNQSVGAENFHTPSTSAANQ
jgi:peptidoglycan/LPS O-acetylase OafA/YrhL